MRWTATTKCMEFWPLLDHIAPTLALEQVRNLFKHFTSRFTALEVLMAICNAEADYSRAAVMNILIKLLGPKPHLRATE